MLNAVMTGLYVRATVSVATRAMPYLILAIPPLVVYGVFYAPMGLLHDNMHPMRHVLTMVKCH